MTEASRVFAVTGTVGARLVVVVAGILTSVITARSLGPEGRGQYYLVMTIASMAAQFGNFGLSSSNVFLGARDSSAIGRLVGNTVWVCAVLSFVTAVVTVTSGSYLAQRFQLSMPMMWMLCLLGPAVLGFTLGSSLLVAEERFLSLNFWQIFNSILSLTLLGAIAAAGAGPGAFLLGTTVAAVASAAGLLRYALRSHRLTLAFDADLFRQGLDFAMRAYIALVLGYLLQRVGATALALYRDAREVGLYSVAAQIYDVLIIVPTSVGMVLFPALIRAEQDGWATTWRALFATMVIMTAGCAATALLARPVLPLVFGQAFAPAYPIVLALLPAAMLIAAVSVLSQYVVSRGFPWALVAVWLAGLVVAAGLAPVLTREHGVVGAAVAQGAGSLAVLIGVAILAAAKVRRARRNG